MASQRSRRGAHVIQEVLGEALARDVADPRLGFVTITEVEASPDMAAATVYFTTLKSDQREPSAKALESARGLLQSRLGRELRTRNTPHLRFVYDETGDRARRVARLIDELAPHDPPPADDGPPPAPAEEDARW